MIRIGIIGCGNISAAYAEGMATSGTLELVAVADLDIARAEARAAAWGVEAVPVEQLLARDDIDIVVNLTVPGAHAEISTAVLDAGMHVYSEKPLATSLEEGQRMLVAAGSAGRVVACAPDTVLGSAVQAARRAIDAGDIGTPIAATAFLAHAGHEAWHPDPDHYYAPGGGPLLDMGPYYLSALGWLLGPVVRVSGAVSAVRDERRIVVGPRAGERVPVRVPTHVSATFEYACGAIGSLTTSFDVAAHHVPHLEIHGTAGSLALPDPNGFDGDVHIWRTGQTHAAWQRVPVVHELGLVRGAGLLDLAHALREERPPRASAELALHVLEVMEGITQSAQLARHVTIDSRFDVPAPMPVAQRVAG